MKKLVTRYLLPLMLLLFWANSSSAQSLIPHVDLTVRYNTTSQQYEVYAKSDSTLNSFYMGGGSQVSIVLPELVADATVTITSNDAAGPWSDNSQVYAPTAQPGSDFHSITTNGTMPAVTYTAGTEVLLFTFTIPGGGCEPGVRIFRNNPEGSFAADPDSGAPGMFGGDFLNYLGEVNTGDNYYKANYSNDGISCIGNPPLIAVLTPIDMPEDSSITVCTTFSDPDTGDSFTASTSCAPSNGTAGTPGITNDTICMTYTPDADWNGTDTICMVVCDQKGLCDTIDVIINVTPVNDDPVIVDVTPNPIPEDTTVTICTPFTDPDAGDTHTASLCNTPGGNASVTIVGNEVCVTYTPAQDFVGMDTLCVAVCDQDGACDSTQVIITVTPENDAPVITDVTPDLIPEDTTVTICTPFTDPDVGDTHTASLCNTTDGTATVAIVGNEVCVTYTPAQDFVGNDTLCLAVCDQDGACDSTEVIITITPVNDDPEIVDVTPDPIPEDTTVTICTPFTDPDAGDTHTASLCNTPGGNASVTIVGNEVCVTYTPAQDFVGMDTLCVAVCDQDGACDSTQVIITVTPENDAPVITDVTPNPIPEDTTVTICTPFTDPDVGDTHTASLCNTTDGTASVAIVGNEVCVTYTPAQDFVGNDTLCVAVCDQDGACDSTEIIITVTPVNDDPVIVDVTPNPIPEDTTVTICTPFTDPDVGDTHTASLCNTTDGTASVAIVGNEVCVTYTPAQDFVGNDTLCVSVCDQDGACDSTQLIITVTPENDAPVITDVTPDPIPEDTTVTICTPFTDPDVGDTHTASLCNTTDGTASVAIVGNEVCVTYTPAQDFVGNDTLCVSVCDQDGACDSTEIIITVTPVNDDPEIVDVTPDPIPEDTTVTICTPFTDPDVGDTHTASLCSTPGGTASVSIVGNEVCVTYTPAQNFVGSDTLCVSVCDQDGACDSTEIIITTTPVNDAPEANDGTATTAEEILVTLTPDFTDVDGPDTLITVPNNPTNGTVSINPDGTIDYTPNTNFVGLDTVTYVVCDGGTPNLCDTADIVVTVTPTNDPPEIVDIVTTPLPEDSMITVCTTYSDPDVGDSFSLSQCGGPNNGAMSASLSGNQICVTYTPTADFYGTDSICIVVCDQDGACDSTTMVFDVYNVNDAPIATDDATTTPEDVAVDLMLDIVDIDGPDTIITVPNQPTNGTATVNPDGTITYTPSLDYIGLDTVTYVVCDGGTPNLCDTASIVIDVLPMSDPPVITTISVTPLPEDSMITVCTPYSDPDIGDTHTATLCNTPGNGLASVAIVGNEVCVTYTPGDDFYGMDTVCISICDQTGACDTTDVVFNVTPVNDAPIAVDDSATIPEDSTVTFTPNITDVDGPVTNVTVPTDPTNGTVTVNPDGTITYVPDLNWSGIDTFDYVVCDGGTPNLCDTAEIIVTVTPVNDAPDITDITEIPMPEDSTITICTVFNDPDDTVFSTTICDPPNNGTASSNIFGSVVCVTYTPDDDYYGPDSLCVVVCDASGACDTTLIPIDVYNINDQPVLGDTSLVTNNNTPISACIEASDVDPMDVLTASTCPGYPANGTVSLDPIANDELCFTYTPNGGYAGEDTLCIILCDNGTPQLCDTVMIPITILADVLAINDINTVLSGMTASGNVLSNDHHDLPITATQLSGPSNGTITLNPDGTYDYTPTAGFTGQDVVTYAACTAQGICDTATLVIQVFEPTAGNDMPIANDDVAETFANTPVAGNVIANDFDPDNNPLVNATVATNPVNGSVSLNPNGTFIYTPNTGFVGIDTFTYKVFDDVNPALCDVATVTIYVTEDGNGVLTNDPPVANTDVESTITGVAIDADLSDNDSDPNNNALVYATTPVTTPSNGNVSIAADGTYTYTPNDGFYGTDEFTYAVCDAPAPGQMVLCDTATVILVVSPPTPNAINDINTVLAGEMTNGNLLTNDEPNGLPVTASVVSTTSNGTFTMNPDGTYDYTPNGGFEGEDVVTYSICNAANICDTATLTIQVFEPTGENDRPIANDDVAQTNKNVPVVGNVLNNDFDPENETLTVNQTPVDGPGNGSVTLLSNGSFTYEPDPNFVGIDSFTYQVCDPAGLCTEATVVIEVGEDFNGTGTNDAPIANDDLNATQMNTSITSTAKPNDSDPNGNALTYAQVGNPSNGTVSMSSNGNFTYTPALGYYGTDQFTYRICDVVTPSANILCDTATIFVTVLPSVPDAVTDINNGFVNMPQSGNILTNDEEGLIPATASVISNAANGNLVLNPDGSYTYTPNNNYVGKDKVDYVLCNDAGVCDTASILLKVLGPDPMNNDAPIANDDVAQTTPNNPVSGNVLVNDIDPEMDPLAASLLSNPTSGTVTLNSDGSYTYSPTPGFSGLDMFTYVACDNASPALCDTATVYVEVHPDLTPGINDAPYAEDDALATNVNAPVSGDLSTNDSDPNGDDLTFSATPVMQPSNGTVTINPDGTYTYTPDSAYVGSDQFQYQVCDVISPSSASKCDTATVYLSVFPQNVYALDLKVMLQGALLGTNGGLMRDDLRTGEHIPFTQPYGSSISNRFLPVGDGAGLEVATAAALTANDGTGDAIVDWVFIELRSGTAASTTVRSIAALVQRDGDIVAADGGQLSVPMAGGSYYIAVKHRNHLGAMTANPLALTLGQTTVFDFTTADASSLWNDATHAGVEQVTITHNTGTVQALWAGNTNADNKTKYDGFGTDMQTLASEVLEAQGGTGTLNYNNAIGYYQGDVNMDGKAKYDGFGNDRILIQQIVRGYPNNTGVLNNYNLMTEQIEE